MSRSWTRGGLVSAALLLSACLARFEVGLPALGEASGSESSSAGAGETGSEGEGEGESSATGNEADDEGSDQDCGETCDPLAEICVETTCLCRPGFERCAGICVELDSNPEHCGSCTNSCAEQEVCDEGECSTQGCSDEQASECAGACVELDDNAMHCGACDQACAGDELCIDADCVGYVFADCESDLECGAGVCCEVELGGDEGARLCVDGDQCP